MEPSVSSFRAGPNAAAFYYRESPFRPPAPHARSVRSFLCNLHLLVWMSFLLGFRWIAIGEELAERPFITIGFLAYLILVALGVTSPKVMVRKLGKKWKRLHRLVYVAAILAIVHLLWILRTDIQEAVLYGGILALLLGYRVYRHFVTQRGGREAG